MDTLSVWRFEAPRAAEDALPRLCELCARRLISVDDAALAAWPLPRRKPAVRNLGCLTGPGALWGGCWGVLFGLIFLVPLAGPTFGAGAGAVAALMADFGIEEDFLKRVRDLVTPGTSALFVFSDAAAADRLEAELNRPGGMRVTLSGEQERRLRDTLGEE
jgi:uncharacterized membrane protein